MPASMGYSSSINSFAPGYPLWDDASLQMIASSSGMPSQDDQCLNGAEDLAPKAIQRSPTVLSAPWVAPVQSYQQPDYKSRRKFMCIMVLLLVRNLTMNLASPEKKILSSYDISAKMVTPAARTTVKSHNNVLTC